VAALRIGADEAYVLESGGGGGYGSPLERPPERVRQDVIEGYVSATAAYDLYGVVLQEGTLALDDAATARRRQELAANG
jgi:N-methylhydantoinase B